MKLKDKENRLVLVTSVVAVHSCLKQRWVDHIFFPTKILSKLNIPKIYVFWQPYGHYVVDVIILWPWKCVRFKNVRRKWILLWPIYGVTRLIRNCESDSILKTGWQRIDLFDSILFRWLCISPTCCINESFIPLKLKSRREYEIL